MNPDIQTKVRKEINTTLGKYDGKINYEAIQSMNYLGKVIDGKFLLILHTFILINIV